VDDRLGRRLIRCTAARKPHPNTLKAWRHMRGEKDRLQRYGDVYVLHHHFVGVYEGKTRDARCQFE
jgi:hypothetical protein